MKKIADFSTVSCFSIWLRSKSHCTHTEQVQSNTGCSKCDVPLARNRFSVDGMNSFVILLIYPCVMNSDTGVVKSS